MIKTLLLSLLLAAPAQAEPSGPQPSESQLSQPELQAMLVEIDERQRNSGDWKSTVFIETKQRDKADLVYQAEIYRRDETDSLVIMFIKPQAEAGKGYLRLDKNLFIYDPTVGKWERRTERERIGGTDSQRTDFDESRLAEEYAPAYVGEETLGKFTVHHVKLSANPGVDVAYPTLELWVDKDTGNILKRQDFALSGRLMRTTYYPLWMKKYSESKGQDIYFPREIRIYDEIEKGNSTTVVMQEVDLDPLAASIFTKAWLEARSR